MGFELHREGDVLHVSGALTIYEAGELNAALQDHSGELVLDLSAVTEFDGAGLQVLIAFHREQVERGHGLRIARPSDPVSSVLRLIGADRYWAPAAEGAA
jgi:anti-sigma B factor antagonist